MLYTFYSDPSHAWLAVPRETVKEFGLLDQISKWSYQRGVTVYLEEDCDAELFLTAYKKKNGVLPRAREEHTDNISPIRSYQRYSN